VAILGFAVATMRDTRSLEAIPI